MCSLYGDHAFVRVMSTEKCVYVYVHMCSLCVCVFVSLYGDHAFVRVMSTEKYVSV